jgi:DNA-3-methyladenine glycosylase II
MSHLIILSKDKQLKKILPAKGLILSQQKNIFLSLCNSILSQQLSTKVADIIQQRFKALFNGKRPSPEAVWLLPDETLRGIGLSNAKVSYVKNVAHFAIHSGLAVKQLNKMTDEEVIVYLTQIKGVGRWTVEMLLMFTLGREDVFAVDDLGIQQAMMKLYRLENTNSKQLKIDMQKRAQKWQPYRTYACMYLWKYKDLK